ncbi:CopG family transcriptional regulator [Krasilnikovia cinnamomea]|nr:CopG family transcriptional regulator [Krasilnikovia cinnamomea]
MAMNFRPSEELAERLRTQAATEQTSVQNLLVKAAEEYLARNTKKAMIKREVELVKTNFADALRRLGEGA